MGTESSSTPGAPKNISRRRVVAGAAWSVPAVMVASAAPAVAASPGFLTFTGNACKLPGASSGSTSSFKGYVFELRANNVLGPQPRDAVTVITSVKVNGIVDPNFAVVVKDPSPNPSCSCSDCGGAPASHQFCTADGVTNQQVLIYTSAEPTGSSSNAEMCISYTVYDCNNTANCGTGTVVPELCSGVRSTPPATQNGGSCNVENVFPLPDQSA